MADKNRPSILIYNPISGKGHLDSWNAMFIELLLTHGWHVFALTSNSDDLKNRLSKKGLSNQQHFQILPWDIPRQSFLNRLWNKLKRECIAVHTSIYKFLKKIPKEEDAEAGYLDPSEFGQRIRWALQQTIQKPKFIFNMYMDLYRTDKQSWAQFQLLNELPWGGIRFVPLQIPVEAYYEISTFSGMCFLDEVVCTQYKQRFSNKQFAYFPDITDATLPIQQYDLVQQIQRLAGDRKIVFMGGAIGGNKNLAKWYELIKLASRDEWYFLQIGEVNVSSLSEHDKLAYDKILKSPPENLFIKDEYLSDEQAFNAVINTSDVIFAVYRDFKISSNMPGKAAAFNKPILVADGYLMAKRVAQYGIGLPVDQDDAKAMLVGLSDLCNHPRAPGSFKAYRDAYSVESLQRNFFDFLNHVID